MNRRTLWAAVIVALTLAVGSGATFLRFDDDYRLVFQSHGAEYDQLLELFRNFETDEADVIIVLEAEDVTTPDRIAAIDGLEQDLLDLEFVDDVVSILAVPSRRNPGRPVFVPGVPESPAMDAARREAREHSLLAGNLLANDFGTTIVVTTLADAIENPGALKNHLAAVRSVADTVADRFDRVRITGIPAIRQAVRESALGSQVRYALLGGGIATLICWLLFRAVGVMIAVGLGAGTAVIWTLGVLGWGGQTLNHLNHLVIELVLIIAFTDAVHLAFHIRRRRNDGWSPAAAARDAVSELWLACALTSLTTVIGFGSLAFAQLAIVRSFGLVCALGTAIGFVAVLIVVPLASLFFPGAFARTPPQSRALDATALAPILWRRARLLAGASLVILAAAAWYGAGLEVDYRYRDFAPASDEAVEALAHSDDAMGGTLPLRVVVTYPPELTPLDGRVSGFLSDVATTLGANPLSGGVFSLLDVTVDPPVPLASLPANLRGRMIREDLSQALVSTRWPDVGAGTHAPQVEKLRTELASLAAGRPGFSATVTGIVAVSATTSTRTIGDLARSLAIATSLIFVVMLAALRSWRLALVSMIANAVPLVGAAAILRATGLPLGYSTALVFSICLGVAVDDTVHFMVRFRRENARSSEYESVRTTLSRVGPVLIVTTAILLGGFGALLTGEAPAVAEMGFLSCVALVLALGTDLFVLPALIGATSKRRGRTARAPLRSVAGLALLAAMLIAAGCSTQRFARNYTLDLVRSTETVIANESDYELARSAAMSTVATLEALAQQHPEDPEIALAAARAYRGIAFGFVEIDELAATEPGAAAAARTRAADLYGRVERHAARALRSLGTSLQSEPDWREALRSDETTMAAILYATGISGRIRSSGKIRDNDEPARLGRLLDSLVDVAAPALHASPLTLRGGLRATAPLHRGGDPDLAREDFEVALRVTGRRSLIVQVLYAETYCTESGDRTTFEALLREVLAASPDISPGDRLLTLVAKRRAGVLLRRASDYFAT